MTRTPTLGELTIRVAKPDDACVACQALRHSIVELCVADHKNDPDILARWLVNKTPETVASWIARPDSAVLVAVEDKNIIGVGMVTQAGEITLNYVSPDARFRGVSRTLMKALEARALEWGNLRCALVSSETARRFYHAAGYAETGPPLRKFGSDAGYPMTKDLTL